MYIGYLALCIFIGFFATKFNRSFIFWALVSAFIDPVLAAIVLICMGDAQA